MNKLKNGYHSPTLGDLPISKVIYEIGDFVDEEPSGFYSLIIGTDSQTKRINGIAEIDFVTAIVIYRQGRVQDIFGKKKNNLNLRYSGTVYGNFNELDVAENIVPDIQLLTEI
jgi:hypothetical protein